MNKCLTCGKDVKNKYCNVSCQNRHQNTERNKLTVIKKYGEFKLFIVKCFNCKTPVNVTEREFQFPVKDKYFCGFKCSNARNTHLENKEFICIDCGTIGLTPKTSGRKKCKDCSIKRGKKIYDKTQICTICNNDFISITRRKTCSEKCKTKALNLAGLRSAEVQSKNRRSKNEKYFAELCFKKFKNVKTNYAMFNGWDADIIIPELKIAVLWNGKWHYEKITGKHSVKQVQNRDEIKKKEIISAGYTPYVIKDMGKFKKEFVEQEFELFLKNTAG